MPEQEKTQTPKVSSKMMDKIVETTMAAPVQTADDFEYFDAQEPDFSQEEAQVSSQAINAIQSSVEEMRLELNNLRRLVHNQDLTITNMARGLGIDVDGSGQPPAQPKASFTQEHAKILEDTHAVLIHLRDKGFTAQLSHEFNHLKSENMKKILDQIDQRIGQVGKVAVTYSQSLEKIRKSAVRSGAIAGAVTAFIFAICAGIAWKILEMI